MVRDRPAADANGRLGRGLRDIAQDAYQE